MLCTKKCKQRTLKVKYYNKVILNFEEADSQKDISLHFSEYPGFQNED